MWELFNTFFEKEFSDLDDFRNYILEDRYALLFRGKYKTLEGFIIIKIHKKVKIEEKEVIVIQGDFFGLKKEYRKNNIPLQSLLLFCIQQKLSNPFQNYYYFFVTYSYRSYLSFARSIYSFYPRHSLPTPPFEKAILDHFGHQVYCND